MLVFSRSVRFALTLSLELISFKRVAEQFSLLIFLADKRSLLARKSRLETARVIKNVTKNSMVWYGMVKTRSADKFGAPTVLWMVQYITTT